jgi:hypothetical protein
MMCLKESAVVDVVVVVVDVDVVVGVDVVVDVVVLHTLTRNSKHNTKRYHGHGQNWPQLGLRCAASLRTTHTLS